MEGCCGQGGDEALERAVLLGQRLNQSVRSAYGIARGLLPLGMDAQGFAPALAELVAGLRRSHRARIHANIRKDLLPRNEEQALHLFRIAQEALGNALRHARARKIRLFWGLVGGQALLEVQDDGQGMGIKGKASDSSAGLGVSVMRYRAQALGGQLVVDSPPGVGVRVAVRIPEW